MKVVALMRWEWQAGDPEKYWQGWQWDGKPGADSDSTELAVGRKARNGSGQFPFTHDPIRGTYIYWDCMSERG